MISLHSSLPHSIAGLKVFIDSGLQKAQGDCHINNVWLVSSLSPETQQTSGFGKL